MVLADRPMHYLPGAYVQFVRYAGSDLASEVLDEKAILAATCQYCVSHCTALHEKRFDLILIEDAAQATEPDAVMPLSLQSNHVSVIQIGDHKQLPASVKHRA